MLLKYLESILKGVTMKEFLNWWVAALSLFVAVKNVVPVVASKPVPPQAPVVITTANEWESWDEVTWTSYILSIKPEWSGTNQTQAMEVDWSYKWKEGVVQALFYSAMLDKEPVLILLVKDEKKDQPYILRSKIACMKAGVKLLYFSTRTGKFYDGEK